MNQRIKGRRDEGPLTIEEVLRRDNVPASEGVPTEIAERLASNKIVLSSDDEGFDPRNNFTKVGGTRGAWELCTRQPVANGLPVEGLERVKPASLKREEGEPKIAEPFRPLWQPHIYHPKTMAADFKPQMLRRKSGAKVRPHAVYNHVALHVNLDKMFRRRRETFTAQAAWVNRC